MEASSEDGPRTGRRWSQWVVLGAELALACVLIVAWYWRGDFREESLGGVAFAWILFMVRTCMFQIGVAVAVAMVVFAAARAWKLVLGGVPALVLSLMPTGALYLGDERGAVEGEPLRVMSFNVLASNARTDRILGQIGEHNPDLLVVQEVTRWRHEALAGELGEAYPFVYRVAWQPWFGMSVFSKRELVGAEEVFAGHRRQALRFEIEVGDGRATVWAIHPPHPLMPRLVRIGRHQFADLLEEIDATPGAKIVVGDCNWGRTSPQAAVLASLGFRDAFDLGGSGRGVTYAFRGVRRLVPGFRIDHVYVSEELSSERAWNGKAVGSDHRPVVAEVGWAE